MKTSELSVLLRQRYPSNEWALAFEVECGRRWVDMIAMNLWPSRGYAIHGFEVKVSRGDWLKELKTPEKADGAYKHCNYWWLVAAENVANINEIPETWGFMEARGNKLYTVKKPERNPNGLLTHEFVASIFRRLAKYSQAELSEAVEKKVKELRDSIDERIQSGIDRRTRRYKEQQQILDEIEKLTGLDLVSWRNSPKEIAQAVKLLLDNDVPNISYRLKNVRSSLASISETIDAAINHIE